MEIENLPKDKIILLFDGVCNLCDSLVQFIIRHDKKDVFRFDSLQSENGIKILRHLNFDRQKMDSMILYVPGKGFFEKSDAALEIGKHIGYRIPSAILKVVPKFIRNPIYGFIARNRYRWFGRKDNCMIPTPETKAKFL